MIGTAYGFYFYKDLEHQFGYCKWDFKFSFWPRRCAKSNKLIFFNHAYRGIRVIRGPGEPLVENYWLTTDEFLIWRLKHGDI